MLKTQGLLKALKKPVYRGNLKNSSDRILNSVITKAYLSTHEKAKKTIKFSVKNSGQAENDPKSQQTEINRTEAILDRFINTFFGPWWPKGDEFFAEDEMLKDLGRRITFKDLAQASKNVHSPNNTTKANAVKNINKSNTVPRHVHMLASDFINNSLYNPDYGYFSKQAMIFSTNEGYQYGTIRDTSQLLETVGQLYSNMEKELDGVEAIPRQIWHTPTELLKPWYGYSIAKYVISKYKEQNIGTDQSQAPPLVLYEVGAGNGTLMIDILKYISENEPEIYKSMEYNVIEISTRLARKQLSRKLGTELAKPPKKISIVNQSIFDWDKVDTRNCFVLAMEVIDNFPHDVVRYDYLTGDPYQCLVYVDKEGEFHEVMEPVNDPTIKEYLEICSDIGYKSPIRHKSALQKIRVKLPFSPNTTKHEYLATYMMQVCKILFSKFPNHNLVLSDFYCLPDTVQGENGPVVQTRYKGNMVPCSTFMVQPGWFDIFFPTNFELLRDIYTAISKKIQQETVLGSKSPSSTTEHDQTHKLCSKSPTILTQEEFARKYADLEKTKTKSGENPMLELYKNNKFLLS